MRIFLGSNKFLVNMCCSVALILNALSLNVAAAEVGDAIVNVADQTPKRIDAPLTMENSVLFDFGFGKVLRVPKMLINPELIPKNPAKPIRAQSISATFIYPDMVLGKWVSDFDKLRARYRPGYAPVLQKDRFPVHITWLYYSPEHTNGLPPGEYPVYPRPAQMERNMNCTEDRDNKKCISGMIRIPSGFKGIDAEHAIDYVKDHPEARIHDPENGGRYVEKVGAPYELSMSCQSLECDAHVFSYKTNFQYRLLFPPESVTHTADIIMSVETMLMKWHKKNTLTK
ncbi:hypothetical protein [Massilia antarctica]|uniref:hypothetical protein n=1 Tax=Massilia antarctica TaxID=2765360 RepID=UPI0006BC13E4|nr:hypothetical protein [Massilia sp. H27-R4]MCY0913210.1 hypothetical protein [Massilia sp. H27-R4]CUI07816.1 hypothetical protein BN2497_10409 [Janthinobacterium sp. CG23_2]CUU31602.1 hypothetical protein BN3177_10409 [Janthinobacterium sp. CG23_2]